MKRIDMTCPLDSHSNFTTIQMAHRQKQKLEWQKRSGMQWKHVRDVQILLPFKWHTGKNKSWMQWKHVRDVQIFTTIQMAHRQKQKLEWQKRSGMQWKHVRDVQILLPFKWHTGKNKSWSDRSDLGCSGNMWGMFKFYYHSNGTQAKTKTGVTEAIWDAVETCEGCSNFATIQMAHRQKQKLEWQKRSGMQWKHVRDVQILLPLLPFKWHTGKNKSWSDRSDLGCSGNMWGMFKFYFHSNGTQAKTYVFFFKSYVIYIF